MTGSALGTVNNQVTPIDIKLAPADRASSTSGCDGAYTEAAVGAPLTAHPDGPSDFAGFVAGRIALVQRGGCSFALKVANAQTAGAAAVILFNQGNHRPADRPQQHPHEHHGGRRRQARPSRRSPSRWSASSFAAGEVLSQAGTTATVAVVNDPQANVIAELDGDNDNNVVMAGGHLDSVPAGPGINDNGSGSAALLETALMLANIKPENTLRFAWWGGEESGLVGSTAYVAGLSAAELDRIAMYMNYDMVGSPNYIQMVYDANESSFLAPAGVPIPPGSEAIENFYERYYTRDQRAVRRRPVLRTERLSGVHPERHPVRWPLHRRGESKTAEQQSIWGGTTGAQFDPCYHAACDSFLNFNPHALEVNSDLIAVAALTFAYSTESVNGVKGKAVPGKSKIKLPTPAGPRGTFVP